MKKKYLDIYGREIQNWDDSVYSNICNEIELPGIYHSIIGSECIDEEPVEIETKPKKNPEDMTMVEKYMEWKEKSME